MRLLVKYKKSTYEGLKQNVALFGASIQNELTLDLYVTGKKRCIRYKALDLVSNYGYPEDVILDNMIVFQGLEVIHQIE